MRLASPSQPQQFFPPLYYRSKYSNIFYNYSKILQERHIFVAPFAAGQSIFSLTFGLFFRGLFFRGLDGLSNG